VVHPYFKLYRSKGNFKVHVGLFYRIMLLLYLHFDNYRGARAVIIFLLSNCIVYNILRYTCLSLEYLYFCLRGLPRVRRPYIFFFRRSVFSNSDFPDQSTSYN